ncbi:MAG: hypothetical protein KDD69_19195 [Bdellovibrionales bacterium]|nr:hypothetical protein [Bdellovibrionales bacterium]
MILVPRYGPENDLQCLQSYMQMLVDYRLRRFVKSQEGVAFEVRDAIAQAGRVQAVSCSLVAVSACGGSVVSVRELGSDAQRVIWRTVDRAERRLRLATLTRKAGM